MTDQEIINLKKSMRDWTVNNHSLEKTGRRFYNKFLSNNLNLEIYPSYRIFKDITITKKNKYIYHYLSLFYKYSDNNRLHFGINYKNNAYIIIGDDSNMLFYSSLDNLSCSNNLHKIFTIINKVDKKIINDETIYSIDLNKIASNLFIYLIFIENKVGQYLPNDFTTIKITNYSSDNLFLRDINNNIQINNILEDKIIPQSNINQLFKKSFFKDKYRDDIIFNNKEDKILFIIDSNNINNFLNELQYNNYTNYFNNFMDSFSISYKLSGNCYLLMLADNDWSNTAYRFMLSLEKNNKHAILLKLKSHKFNYNEQGIILKNGSNKNSINLGR